MLVIYVTTFFTQVLAHGNTEIVGIDKLHLTTPLLLFAVGQHPDVGGDARVVEKLLRQGHNRLEPVVLQYPAADLALTTPGIAREERRAIHDDSHAASAPVGFLHTRQQVLQEEQLPVADTRRTGPEAARVAPRGLGLYRRLVHLPLFAKGRIGEQVIKVLIGVLVS